MNPQAAGPTLIERQTRALLDLVESHRAQQCAHILGAANSQAAALRAQAQTAARARMRQTFEEQRLRLRERVAAAQAQLATQRRLYAQQRHAAFLRLAWEQLPAELLALWRQPATRAAWAAHVFASARARMPRGAWRIVHAPDWPAPERQALVVGLDPAPQFEAEPTINSGLKIVAGGNVIDGTLAGMLADRAELEARLLHLLEPAP